MKKQASLLHNTVEPIPSDGLGAEGDWTWVPSTDVSKEKLGTASPTTEYSSNESAE